jgi:hypothetical protein
MSHTLKPIMKPKEDRAGKFAFLTDRQALMIDQALRDIGEFGEVRLIVEKRRLRFLVTVKSSDMQKLQIDVDI